MLRAGTPNTKQNQHVLASLRSQPTIGMKQQLVIIMLLMV
jgi:hypothetical protein